MKHLPLALISMTIISNTIQAGKLKGEKTRYPPNQNCRRRQELLREWGRYTKKIKVLPESEDEIEEVIEEVIENEIIESIEVDVFSIEIKSENGDVTLDTHVENFDDFKKSNEEFFSRYIQENEFSQENIKYILTHNTSKINSKAMECLKQLLSPKVD